MPESVQYRRNRKFSCIRRKGKSFLVDSAQGGLLFKVILTSFDQCSVTSSSVQCREEPQYVTEEPNRKKKTPNKQLQTQNLKILNRSLQDGNENACLVERLTSAKKAMSQC